MSAIQARRIFITGGTGYLGQGLIPRLCGRGHHLTALVRADSVNKLRGSAAVVLGDALIMDSYGEQVAGADTFIHLVGVAHPSPRKAAQFRSIDKRSLQVAVDAARAAGVRHFIYVSVAQPAPIMQAYVSVRAECEAVLRASGLNATFLRPWYVLGRDHRWPYVLLPLYWLAERFSRTRTQAQQLGLITLTQMLTALVWAVEHPPDGVQVLEVPRIRSLARMG